jgi:hypothetical protein
VLPRDWKAGSGCSDFRNAVAAVPEGASTLAGWSLGRLGPLYYLAGATEEQRKAIKNIVLFDPGSYDNLHDGCDSQINPSAASLLADWIASDQSHRLIVYTGHDTEDKPLSYIGKSTFGGIWHFYFPKLWNQPFADRVAVCDYDNISHPDILKELSWTINQLPTAGTCPSIPGKAPKPWHP